MLLAIFLQKNFFNDLLLIECTNIVLKNLYCPIIIMILFKTH